MNVGVSLLRIAQGFGLAAAAALALGVLVGVCPPLRLMLEPVVDVDPRLVKWKAKTRVK